MPNVKGRIDHMDVDVEGKRLFVAAVENGSMEVVDFMSQLRSRKQEAAILVFEPQP